MSSEIRDLFADAEQDQRTRGDESDLHVIIFDEIDAICKIDGVESLNNVLLIGMTNRKDMLDEALLRPGRLEVQVEISLPNENGQLQILQIHTNKMKENSFRSPDVNLQELDSSEVDDEQCGLNVSSDEDCENEHAQNSQEKKEIAGLIISPRTISPETTL
ncbi:hypothetical protein V8G54_013502 [Vigna mungo]|uniref:Vesicle-fusing ATPase n=1 Tax=Vigna mungo TaxID=3915 RepID=A0AAQ3S4Z2_VIGMU